MIKTWMLILWVSTAPDTSIVMENYNSYEDCELAGRNAQRSTPQTVNYACSPEKQQKVGG